MDLRSRIRAWLVFMGWKQSELAEKSGLSRAAISQICGTGKYKSTPSQKALEKIVGAFGITMERFYGEVPRAPVRKRAA
jgi:transcriptional regulator with XRE-family HTH domain